MGIFEKVFGLRKRQAMVLDIAARKTVYAEYNQAYQSELEKARKRVFDDLRVSPGQDPFFAMGAATQQFGQGPEPKRIRKATLASIAAKHQIDQSQLLAILSQGEKEKW